MEFNVSVIIPAYNAEKYIEKTISSVFQQPEVTEIVVINDGSTDGTLKIIKRLQKSNPIIKIYHHSNKENKGRSATRNLGIKKATGNFIAFLDADDFYLKNRFKNDKKIFRVNINCDGVYNAIGVHFYRKSTKLEEDKLKLTTVTKIIEPENIFEGLLSGKYGYFSIDGLTVRKSIFNQTGMFNEQLVVAEDTDLFYKMTLKSNLICGIINQPLAMRGVHENNVSGKVDLYRTYELKMYESLFFWTSEHKLNLKIIERFLERIWIIRYRENNSLITNIYYWFYLVINSPKVLATYLTMKYFPIIRLRRKLFPFLYN